MIRDLTPGHFAVLIRFNELALKGKNRSWFEDRLIQNIQTHIRRQTGNTLPCPFTHDRIFVAAPLTPGLKSALETVSGIHSFSPVYCVETSLTNIKRAAIELASDWIARHGTPPTFRIRTHRAEKVLDMKSPEIDAILGSVVLEKFPTLSVDLKAGQLTIGVEIRKDQSFVWTERFQGLGGLPVGTHTPALALLSGGIDSPVAAIQILRRGTPVSMVHFYGTPFVDQTTLMNVEDLARAIHRYSPFTQKLFVVPFGKIQEQIALKSTSRLRTILYRRMMIRIADQLAHRIGAQGLITGESLGQVASQTIENIATVNQVAQHPILRPLIGHDKEEIIALAKKYGTYDISIRPNVDCCTLFADRHPILRSSVPAIEAEEANYPVQELVQAGLNQLQTIDIQFTQASAIFGAIVR